MDNKVLELEKKVNDLENRVKDMELLGALFLWKFGKEPLQKFCIKKKSEIENLWTTLNVSELV